MLLVLPNVEVSGGVKAAKQALARPLDRQVRRSRVEAQGRGTTQSDSKLSQHARLKGGRAVCQSGGSLQLPLACHPNCSVGQRAAASGSATSRTDCAPLVDSADGGHEHLTGDSTRCLTFDMSGGAKAAKRPLGRPLDGGVRSHAEIWSDTRAQQASLPRHSFRQSSTRTWR